jgi:hypothetical protein
MQKALEGIKHNPTKARPGVKRTKNSTTTNAAHRNDRESMFTGKSIQIIAKNDRAPKIREAKVRGE